ncbi:MAG: hypothetical protein ACRD4P_04820 [Bryobacteraceae bacterium]
MRKQFGQRAYRQEAKFHSGEEKRAPQLRQRNGMMPATLRSHSRAF